MMVIQIYADEKIQKDVLDEFQWDARMRPAEVGVAVKDGIVMLTGQVDSYLKKLAAEAAHRVHGVRAVVNDLEVHLPGSAERTDADLAQAVVNALKWDTALPADKIEVTVSQGQVALKGEVEDAIQKYEAERAIRSLAGITEVRNVLQVRPRIPPTDLKAKIEQALVRNAETDARNILVEVEGTKVILRGTVSSPAERKAAAQTALSAPGITEVVSRLVVSYPSSSSDTTDSGFSESFASHN